MPVTRLFNTLQDAQDAAAELVKEGFRDGDITLVTSAQGYVAPVTLQRKGVLSHNAAFYAPRVREGQVLAIVGVPLGTAALATEILEKPRGQETGTARVIYEGGTWDDATAFSSSLGLPVLLSGMAAPLSSFWSLPVLTKGAASLSRLLGLPLLSKSAAPLSGLFGMATLARNGAPLSSLLGLPVLTKR